MGGDGVEGGWRRSSRISVCSDGSDKHNGSEFPRSNDITCSKIENDPGPDTLYSIREPPEYGP